MVFGFFSRRSSAVAGSTVEEVATASVAPAHQPDVPQSIVEDPTTATEGKAPELTMSDTIPLQRTQSKSAFAFWKEKEQKQLYTPTPSISGQPATATPPPPTPTPPPRELITDPRALYTLISSVPAQTLRSYCLDHLNPANFPPPPSVSPKSRKRKSAAPQTGTAASAIISRGTHRRSQSTNSQTTGNPEAEEQHKEHEEVLSPETLTMLTHFFRTLEPPPQLHCVRCHKGYFDLENTDTSCRVPHDDESAIVERIGVSLASRAGDTATYETLWGCCGKTVEGDGDQGPPDGWCYEGRHTVDNRRARFRMDSTAQDDKLTSCTKMRCFRPPVSKGSDSDGESVRVKRKRTKSMAVNEDDDAKSATSEAKRRKRNTKKVQEEEEEDAKSVASEPKKRRTRTRKVPISPEEVHDDDDNMDVDEEKPAAPSAPATPKRARGRPPKSTTQTRSRSVKPRSTAREASPASRGSNSVVVAIRRSSRSPARPSPALGSRLKQQMSIPSMKNLNPEEQEAEEETQKTVPAKTPRKRGRPRKALSEVVDSSVAAEKEMSG